MPIPGEEAALADIHSVFAQEVLYTGGGLTDEAIAAVESDDAAADFMGTGDGLRSRSYEIRFAAWTAAGALGEPEKDDLLTDAEGAVWTVIDPVRRSDIAAWVLMVEEYEP